MHVHRSCKLTPGQGQVVSREILTGTRFSFSLLSCAPQVGKASGIATFHVAFSIF